MTQSEILLVLLEKARKYEYSYIKVYSTYGWDLLSEIDIKKPDLDLHSYYGFDEIPCKGFAIRLYQVESPPEGIEQGGRYYKTIDNLTLVSTPQVRTLRIYYKG